MQTHPRRLAMWSGPRNISTALLRAFENRSDTVVVDEPLYACYLQATGKDHPGRAAILAAQSTSWRAVLGSLVAQADDWPEGCALHYQKHMAHHLLDEVERSLLARFLDQVQHAFLIRDPARMLVSLDRVTRDPELADTGLPQQVELFRRVGDRLGSAPPVLDSDAVLADPRGQLEQLCDRWRIAFDEAMLAWRPGPRTSDGVWAPHWYAAVQRSTGFQPARLEPVELPERLRDLHERCLPYYQELQAVRLQSPTQPR